jgi:DNA-binding CsgD family transcriptional regulator
VEGRDHERARFDELLRELRDGRGSALLLRGEPGIGKTALLDELVRRCGVEVTVLRASGVQTEADLAFAALSDLLAPVLDGLAELPPPQADAMRAALALGPPSPGDRLAVCVATVGLLGIAARAGPVLAAVDDFQWLDAASRECIRFAARRASGRLAVVLAARDTEHVDGHGLPTVRVGPLPLDAARAVLQRTAPDLAAPVTAALLDAAAGVPLALVELPATLTSGQRAGAEPLDLPLSPGARVSAIVTRRTAVLSAPARRILLLLAADGECDVDLLATAAARMAANIGALDEAEARGLVRIQARRVGFAHPLIRSVVWRGAASEERRVVHRALAAVSAGEARAWHRAAASVGTDEEVAAELERAAGAASARRGFASAASALERAAQLSPDPEKRARRTCAAGEAAAAAGLSARASRLLDRGARATTDTALRLRTARLHALVRMRAGEVKAAVDQLIAEAELHPDDPLAAPMLADAAFAMTYQGELTRSSEVAERAVRLLASGDPLARAHAIAVLGWSLVLLGRIPEARPALAEAERLAGPLDPLRPATPVLLTALNWRLPSGEFERALDTGQALAARARTAGALSMLASPLYIAAGAAYRLGHWDTAEAALDEALQTAAQSGQHLYRGLILSAVARLAAARGAEERSRAAARQALALADGQDIDSGRNYARSSLGFLELGLGRVREAIGHLEPAAEIARRHGVAEHGLMPWSADLIEAYARAGRTEEARHGLAALERDVIGSDVACPRAMHARCLGMLTDDYDAAFAEALAWHDRRPMPFERARTQLAYGRRLYREGRRADARVPLRAALEGFERLGAEPWAARARDELRAAGGRLRATSVGDGAALSAQEARVATAAARGGSTREIAAGLFLAPKTVEFHLGQIYRKLGVRTRAQMVAVLAGKGVEQSSDGG